MKDKIEENFRSEIPMAFFSGIRLSSVFMRRLLPTSQFFHRDLGVGISLSVGYFLSKPRGQHQNFTDLGSV